ncbi:putative inorganic phosphate cotransporter [Lucilia sericata]|uniref:putative inorganic phosphate cotransporter n=1 Tax=Lucilia sericata TaxID=13632 RepID=UPI0018A87317|nr:putative inorganic phosphate cotransporter [Lucilia sericata]
MILLKSNVIGNRESYKLAKLNSNAVNNRIAYDGPILGQRHVQVVLLSLCTVVSFIVRLSVSISVVAMTNAKATNPDFPEYKWSEMEKSYVLSSFFVGYFITQFPGGLICNRFGVKKVLFLSFFGSSVLSILVPLTIDWGGWQIYCAIRLVQGLLQGPLFPCLLQHLAVWCPTNERNRLGAITYTAIDIGIVLGIYTSSIIAASSMGWPGISYVSCALGLILTVPWLIFASNSPNTCRFISQAEINYINEAKTALMEQDVNAVYETIPVPWKAILGSVPFWALLITRAGCAWGNATIQTEIPSYMNSVLDMDIKGNALFYALPFLTQWIMSNVYIILENILMKRRLLTLNALRKTFNSLAFWIPAGGLLLLGFLDKDQKIFGIILMICSLGIFTGATIGSALNAIDLSPNHVGILMGIINTTSNIVSFVVPLFVGLIVEDVTNRNEWQTVFSISAAIFGLTNLLYIIYGSTNIQPWDHANYHLLKEKV